MSTPVWRRGWLRDALLVALLAVVTFQALRKWYGDRYLVPSGSMEPVLHGDPTAGDVVFVDKTARAGDRRRHSLVVVMHPEQPGQPLVKRIAACGDDSSTRWLDIRQGDVWLGDSRQRLVREQKEPLAARELRVPWADTDVAATAALLHLQPSERTELAFVLPPVVAVADEARVAFRVEALRRRRFSPSGPRLPIGCVGTARPVDAGYLDRTGARSLVGTDQGVFDCGIELELASAPPELLATVEARGEALTFHWQPQTGRVVLWRNGEDVAAAQWPVVEAPRRFEFARLDDRVYCCVDARPDLLFVVAREASWNERDENGMPAGPATLAHVAAVGPAASALRFRRLLVFHDLFAWRDPIVGRPGQPGPWPREVPPGHWFLLGDSAFDSRDSRQFGAVPMASMLGVPSRVLGPWARARRLP